MAIDGLSQSSGVERLLDITRVDAGVQLVIRDRIGSVQRARVVLAADDLLSILTERPVGCQTINLPASGVDGSTQLDIEVRKNEVLLWARSESEPGWDVAVGLDDFQDALEATLDA